MPSATQDDRPGRSPDIMRALESEVVAVLWQAFEPLPPRLGPIRWAATGHEYRTACFPGLLIRLVTGSSWVDIEAILEHQVSDTTLRARRDEWIAAGVSDRLRTEALAAFDRIVGLDLTEV